VIFRRGNPSLSDLSFFFKGTSFAQILSDKTVGKIFHAVGKLPDEARNE
jgi:hypothetical protein